MGQELFKTVYIFINTHNYLEQGGCYTSLINGESKAQRCEVTCISLAR